MLVLARKENQRIFAGDVTITVVEIDGPKVRLGIEAPRHVPIDREEVRLSKINDSQPPAPGKAASNG